MNLGVLFASCNFFVSEILYKSINTRIITNSFLVTLLKFYIANICHAVLILSLP